MRVAKWQGIGNDYLVIEETEVAGALTPEQVSVLCDRHLGLGADGVLLHCRATGAVPEAIARMRIFNPDGSESEMCGNGMRIFARYLWTQGLVGDKPFTVETLAGPIRPHVLADGQVCVDMGSASFNSASISASAGSGDILDGMLQAGERQYRFTFVDVGNPHCVIQVADPSEVDLATVGPVIENHPYFPNRVNAEFVAMKADGSVQMRVWERGVGETQACGTGATAVGAACVRLGLASSPVTVHLLGGDLIIGVEDGSGDEGLHRPRVFMTGPAEEVFTAEVSAPVMKQLGLQ